MRILLGIERTELEGEARRQLAHGHPEWLIEAPEDTQACVRAAQGQPYDLVVWELEPTSEEGLAAVRELRALCPNSIIVVLVAPGEELLGAQAVVEGADHYLTTHRDWDRELPLFARRAELALGRRGQLRRLAETEAEVHRAQVLMAACTDAILFTTPTGVVLSANSQAGELLGYESGQLIGRPFGQFLVASAMFGQIVEWLSEGEGAALPGLQGGVMEARRLDSDTVELTCFIRHRGGHYLLCTVIVTAVRGPEQGLQSILVTLRLTEPEEPAGYPDPDAVATGVFEVLAVGLGLLDSSDNLLRGNSELARLLDCDLSELVGRPFSALLVSPQQWEPLRDAARDSGQLQRAEVALLSSSGRIRSVSLGVAPVTGDPQAPLIVSLSDLTQLRALEARSEEQARQLSDLAAAMMVVSQGREIEDIGQAILGGLEKLLSFDVAVVRVQMAEEQHVCHRASIGLPEALQANVLKAIETECRADRVRHCLDVTIIEDLEAYCAEKGQPTTGSLLAQVGLRSGCRVPLVVGGEVVGILYFASRMRGAYEPELENVLSAYAAQAAGMLTNGVLYQKAQRASEFAERLQQVALTINAGVDLQEILKQIAEAAVAIADGACSWVEILGRDDRQFETTYTHCPDEEIGRAVYLQVQDIAWTALDRGELADAEFELTLAGPALPPGAPSRAVAMPMVVNGMHIGVLMVAYEGAGPLDAAQINALQLLAAHGGVAIRNVQLYELAQRRSSRMEALAAQAWEEEARARTLFEAAAAVTETADLGGILSQIARSAAAEIGFERVRIYLADHDNKVLKGATEAHSDGSTVDISGEEVALRVGDSLLADAALGSAPYVILPIQAESDAGQYECLFMPLRAQNSLVGIITADNPHRMEPLPPQQTRLLRSLAMMTSVAIERARVEELRIRFLSAVSHELRAPLASVQAYNELVLDEEVGPLNEEQRVYLSRVDAACVRLKRMIEDLMSWSRLQSGEISVDKQPTDIDEMVTAVMAALRPQAEKKQLRTDLDIAKDLPIILTDPARVEQILTNLIDNAIKFSHARGKVKVSARVYQDKLVVAVADTGPGIPEEMHQSIFQEFHRGPEDVTKGQEGVGLGLAIASRLAEYLGGNITLDSAPGRGSIFFLWLPLETPPLSPQDEMSTSTQ